MSVLFTDSHKAMVEAINRLKIWHLVDHPPFYLDILGLAFCGLTFILLVSTLVIPAISIVFEVDPLIPFLPIVPLIPINFPVILLILIRYLFFVLDTAVIVRWGCFVFTHLAMVLSVGNTGLILLRKCINTNYRLFVRKRLAWERLEYYSGQLVITP
ncbi:unnamed protein product [Orchesella dallaii]|uniref:Uncharacterized protein n=1 Tax=Orchesella dallaii TaxID=48710 RepID=A0ABP1Q2U5_9HEXA